MTRPSMLARMVAHVRATVARPEWASGDAAGAARLGMDLRLRVPVGLMPTVTTYLTARTRYFDEALLAALEHAPCQVVILGAGYDDRAVRYRTPGVTFVEVDLPTTQEDKRERLTRLGVATDDIVFIAADLAVDGALSTLTSTLDATRPTFVLCEALVPYLPTDTVGPLAHQLAALPGSDRRLAIEMPIASSQSGVARMVSSLMRLTTRATGESVVNTYASPDDADATLVAAGWRITARQPGRELGMSGATGEISYVTATS